MAFPLLDQPSDQQISALYIAFFGRASDPDGLAFWVNELETAIAEGADPEAALAGIAESFRFSDEAMTRFPFLDPDATAVQATVDIFVQNMIQNLFNRPPTLEENETVVDSFAAALSEENGDIGNLIVDLIEEAGTSTVEIDRDGRVVEVERDDRAVLENKLNAAVDYSDAFAESGQSFTLEANRAGAEAVLADVTGSPSSLEDARDLTETILSNNAGDFDILAQPVEAQAASVFTAFFGRAPDPGSLSFCAGQLATAQANGTEPEAALVQLAESLAASPEATSEFQVLAAPTSALAPTAQIFTDDLFNNLFGRSPTIAENEGVIETFLERFQADEPIGDLVVGLIRDASNDTPVEVDQGGRVVEVDSNDNTVLANRVAASLQFAESLDESGGRFSLAEDRTVAEDIIELADASEQSLVDALDLAEAAGESATPALLGTGGGEDAFLA